MAEVVLWLCNRVEQIRSEVGAGSAAKYLEVPRRGCAIVSEVGVGSMASLCGEMGVRLRGLSGSVDSWWR